MFISVSKIQFESKSQHIRKMLQIMVRCLSVCQRYNLKANHNSTATSSRFKSGVYQCVKDTIWKQITTRRNAGTFNERVFISVSKIQFESKSQRGVARQHELTWCLSVCQRYNLKANHNCSFVRLYVLLVFISVSKIQFESKSQLYSLSNWISSRCLSVCQRYNLKANHNA